MSHTYTCFEISTNGGVAHIEMCRGDELNTMIRAFWAELPQLLKELDASGTVRAAVLSGQGRHFCAGMALENFATDGSSLGVDSHRALESAHRMTLDLQDCFTALERVRFPVLAAMHGACIGGAIDMATACDMRYCSADAFFCIQEINLAIVADVGTTQRLPRLIPEGVARELAYTGDRMGAARAREVGLVNHVYETREQMLEEVLAIAAKIASKSPLAVTGTKAVLNFSRDHSIADGLEYVATWNSGMLSLKDLKESMLAMQEKREAVYEDLAPVRRFEDGD